MKSIKYGVCLFMLFALAACSSGGGSDGDTTTTASTSLEVGRSQQGYIENNDNVDIYRIRANEVNRYMLVHVGETTSGSGVDLLVTVYEEEANGERRRIFGKHKPQGGGLSADLDLWIYIDAPKDLIIEVRDLMADDHNTEIPYFVNCTYQDSGYGNHDFSTAQELSIGADNAITETISTGGEVDCFTFSPDSNGVYTLSVDHQKTGGTSDVELAVSLYDRNGNRILRVQDPNDTILAYLESANGPYNVSVEDSDSMHGDAASPYDISVVPVNAAETQANDVVENAETLTADGEGVFTATGAIDYGSSSVSPDLAGDKDWYSFTVGTVGGATTYHPIEMTIDDGVATNSNAKVIITLYDSNIKEVTHYSFKGGTDAYTNQVRLENGEYFLLVEPAGASQLTQSTAYRIQLRNITSIDDSREIEDKNMRDYADDHDPLSSGVATQGYISYLSDVDWYRIQVPNTSDNVLSVDFRSNQSIVDYQISIWLGDQMIKKVTESMLYDEATHLKTSILIPASGALGSTDYHIKVCDAQNNEGSDVQYALTAELSSIGSAPGPIDQTGAGTPDEETPVYYDETGMEAAQTGELELEILSSLQPTFKYNSDLLDFRTHTEYQSAVGETTVITMPWISGYIDYQDDRDFFQLDLDKLDPNGAETSWYYDVEVQLVVPGASSVEHVWKLYLDHNSNNIIIDAPSPFDLESELENDTYKACAGDTTPESMEANFDLTTPKNDEVFWIGSNMSAGAKYFFSISDFNYMKLPGTGADAESDLRNPNPDGDWSYEDDPVVPYYFRITLTYHPGNARPN